LTFLCSLLAVIFAMVALVGIFSGHLKIVIYRLQGFFFKFHRHKLIKLITSIVMQFNN